MKRILIITIAMLLSGCINNDINNLALINEIIIDYNDNYKIYVNLIPENKNQKTIIEEGKTIEECFSKLSQTLSKKIYLTHLEILGLTDNIKKQNIKDIINYFLKQETSRNNFNTIIINKITNELFDIKPKDIENMLKNSINTNGIVKEKKFDDIIKDILNYKLSYIPFFNIENKKFIGYKSVYEEENLLSKDQSIAINFILNNIRDITLLINEKDYKLEKCYTTTNNKNNKLLFNIKCNTSESNTQIIKDYLNNEINSFIKENNNSYFEHIKNKLGIKENSNIDFKINMIKTNIDPGDSIE